MTVYGFKREAIAQRLLRMANNTQNNPQSVPLLGRAFGNCWLVKTPEGGIPKAVSGPPDLLGFAECTPYYVDDNDYTKEQKTFDNSTAKVTVYNLREEDIEGDIWLIATMVGQKAIAVVAAGDAGVGWCRFKTVARIVDREVDAVIDLVVGSEKNPNTGQPFAIGDSVKINDPENLWSDIESNATGTAFWRDEPDTINNCSNSSITYQWSDSSGTWSILSGTCSGPDCGPGEPPSEPGSFDGETQAVPCVFIGRWDIETCSLPINEIRVKLAPGQCLLYSTATATGEFGSDPQEFIRSAYPNCDPAPEWIGSQGAYQVQFQNSLRLDSVADGYLILRRITNRNESEYDNLDTPLVRSTTGAVWELVQVDEQIARWATWTKNSSAWDLADFWEGGDPAPCFPTDMCLFDCSCMKDGETAISCYVPEQNQYRLFASASGMLGEGTKTNVVAYDSPGNAPRFECNAEGESFDLKYETREITVFCAGESTPTSAPIGQDIFDCLDLCEYICTYCEVFANDPDTCDPCKGQCVWTYEAGATGDQGRWVLTDECEGGEEGDCGCYEPPPIPTPTPANGTVVTKDCGPRPPWPCCEDCLLFGVTTLSGDDPVAVESASMVEFTQTSACTFDVYMSNEETWTVTYNGATNWTVTGRLGSHDFTINPTGFCSDDMVEGDGTVTINLQMQAEDCDNPPPECCEGCLFPDDAISSLELSFSTGDYLTTRGPSRKILDLCAWEVPVTWNAGDPAQDEGTVTAEWLGAEWRVTGFIAEDPLRPFTVSGIGDCTGADPLLSTQGPATDPDGVRRIYADGEECEPCGTCTYEWVMSWVQTVFCEEGCTCVPPVDDGVDVGDQTTTPCTGNPCELCCDVLCGCVWPAGSPPEDFQPMPQGLPECPTIYSDAEGDNRGHYGRGVDGKGTEIINFTWTNYNENGDAAQVGPSYREGGCGASWQIVMEFTTLPGNFVAVQVVIETSEGQQGFPEGECVWVMYPNTGGDCVDSRQEIALVDCTGSVMGQDITFNVVGVTIEDAGGGGTPCETDCTWVWQGGWVEVQNDCIGSCDCAGPPAFPGTIEGEFAQTFCESVPVAAMRTVASKSRLGEMFALANPDLFKGCGCKKGVIAVMNRWELGKVAERQIDNVAKTIHNKNKSIQIGKIKDLLRIMVS